MSRSSLGLSGMAAPPPLLVTLRTGQPKFMSRWSTRPSPTRSAHRLAHVARVDAVELQAARRLLRPEAREEERLAVALHERAGGDHLAHVEAGAVPAAERAEGRVRDPRHGARTTGGQTDERADAEGRELARPTAGGTSRFSGLR